MDQPLRTCIVTKQKLPKKELLRLVLENNEVVLDLRQNKQGRGCYILPKLEILEEAYKKNRISWSLKIKKMSEENLAKLRSRIEDLP